MNIRSNRRLAQKRKKPSQGFFRCAFFVLVSAAVLVSILTLFLSGIAIKYDITQSGQLGGRDIHRLEARPKEPNVAERRGKVKEDSPKPNVLSSGTGGNNDIDQPTKTGRRLLTYGRFGGRLNNQLFQFTTSLQHAKVLKRTLVVPNEVRDVDWTGMFDVGFGIWDLESLNNAYDIDWTLGLSAEFATTGVPEECMMNSKEAKSLLNGGPQLWKKWDDDCPDVIHIGGSSGLLFCDRQHQFCGDSEAQMEAYKIYEHLKLSPSLMQYIPSKKEEFKNQGYGDLAIHSRRAGEGGYDWELCVTGNTKTCVSHLDGTDRDKFCDVRTMKGNCAAWVDLDYQIKSKSALKKKPKDYRFVLASDGTHDWSIDWKNQFVVANNTDWLLDLEKKVSDAAGTNLESMGVSAIVHSNLRNKKDLSKMRGKLDALTATLLDLFSLVDSKYFLGAHYSTLSLNACLFRGLDRIYDSNMCWMLMHPNSKHAIIPLAEADSVNIKNPKEEDRLPAALMSDIEHAFVRSEDGNFIAIDRYLIHYNGKQVISILGDGLLPITIAKNDKGEETISAKFTCNIGHQLDSPATVILMKGNKSYQEHYYEQGDKYNTPFSTNGDRFRTTIIMCEKLFFDRSLSRHPPLILKSPDGKFSLSVGSTFQRPIGQVMSGGKGTMHEKLVHCLNPVYGLKDPRWVIEYLEYHKAIGVSQVHIYNVDMHTPEVQSALQAFRDEKFITRHDWSAKASGGYTTQKTYEHAKWAAQTDCAIRSRGLYDFALFSDIDEVVVGDPKKHLAPALEMCAEAKKRGILACSFNSNTVSSIYTKLNEEEEAAMKDKLILERYDRIEASPHCPSNCKQIGSTLDRKFHSGRQKYIANVIDLHIPPRPMWTHALARDYDEMDKIMEVLPDEVMHVRHYQGHWYKNNNLLNSMEEKESPLPEQLMDTVRVNLSMSKDKKHQFTKRLVYDKAKFAVGTSVGVEWITPVERPAQYHSHRWKKAS